MIYNINTSLFVFVLLFVFFPAFIHIIYIEKYPLLNKIFYGLFDAIMFPYNSYKTARKVIGKIRSGEIYEVVLKEIEEEENRK